MNGDGTLRAIERTELRQATVFWFREWRTWEDVREQLPALGLPTLERTTAKLMADAARALFTETLGRLSEVHAQIEEEETNGR